VTTFVLVHPAWMGGWCWDKVASNLRELGHEVHAPTLTGLGERSHLATPAIGLSTHIADVADALTSRDLHEVTLVGTSSAGTVITGVADTSSDRISSLVYLDAFLPSDGQCTLDLMPKERREALERFVAEEGDGWLVPRFAPAPWHAIVGGEVWQVTDDADVEWLLPRLRPTPFGHFDEPVTLARSGGANLDYVYVRCTGRPPAPFDQAIGRVQSTPGWRYLEIGTPHVPYITHPDRVTAMLAEIAGDR
jgi:pimeloyl-ACP methyl ester carboxylesterase